MYFDDNADLENPVEGKGEEMLPRKGLPFDEELIDEEEVEEEIVAEVEEVKEDIETVEDDVDNEPDEYEFENIEEFEEVDEGPTELEESILDEDLGIDLDEEPRDLTAEELASLLGGTVDIVDAGDGEGEMPDDFGRDSDGGMGAAYPILGDEDLLDVAPLTEIEMEMPAEESRRGMPLFDEAALLDTDVISGMAGEEVRQGTAHLESSKEMVDLLVTKERILSLWNRIDGAHLKIRTSVPSLPIARQLLDQVERGRNELLAGRGQYEEAERSINEVELRLAVIQRAQDESNVAYKLLAYELVWGLVFGWGLLEAGPIFRDLVISAIGSTTPTLATDLVYATNAVILGGVGGIFGALLSLWRHVSRELDFNKQFSMWYITSPIMGMFMGAISFLTIKTGVIGLTSSSQEISQPLIIYLLALLVGYQQNVAYELVRRVLKVFQIKDTSDDDSIGSGKN